MSYSTQGASNRQIYDCCNYAQTLQQSVDPLQYNLYFGAGENCSKCIDKNAWFKQDRQIVDIESELRNQTRPLSRCDFLKYNPNCKTSDSCISTFDPNIPRILSPSLCPIVYNNIPVQTSPGYTVPNPDICPTDEWRRADDINTYKAYVNNNKAILGNSNKPEDVFMFLNTCDNKPLYTGSMEKVRPYLANDMISRPYKADDQVYMPGSVKGPMAYGGMGGARGVPNPPNMDVNMGRNVPVTPEMNMGISNGKMVPNGMRGGMMDAQLDKLANMNGAGVRKALDQMIDGARGMIFDEGAKYKMPVSPESDEDSMYDSDDDYEQI